MAKHSVIKREISSEILEDAIKGVRYNEIKKEKFVEWMGLEPIASDFVMTHDLHSQALKATGLAYTDELLDAIAIWHGGTVREIIAHLLRLVPDLSEEKAVALAKLKYQDLDWDTPVAR